MSRAPMLAAGATSWRRSNVRFGTPAAVLLLYTSLACWLTWPLPAQLATHLPLTYPAGYFDPLYSAWALAWESQTLASGSFAVADANIYYPTPDALFYGPAAFGALPLFAPVYLATGNAALALNVLLIASVVLCAVAAHFVVRAWTGLHAAGFVAAAVLLTNRWLMFSFVPTAPHLAVLFYFPLIIFLSAAPELSARRTLALLAVTVLQCLTDAVYIAPAVLAPLAVSAILSLLRHSTRRRGIRLGLVVVAAAAAVAALHTPYLRVAAANPHLIRQTNWRRDPRAILELPGGLLGELSPLAVPTSCLVSIAAAAALAVARGFRGTPREVVAIRHVLLWVAVGVLMSLPLQVAWDGHVFTLPHLAALEQWPIAGRVLRLPERLRLAALMGVALLCGLAFAELTRQLRRAGRRVGAAAHAAVAAGLAAVMYAQYALAVGQPTAYGAPSTRYRLLPAPRTDSPVLQVLRAQGGPTLEVPLPHRRTRIAGAHAPAMFRSIAHRQPLLNGYSSYWPAQFVERMVVAARLPEPDAVRALRETTGLAFVLVRIRSVENVDPSLERERAVWLDFVRQGGRPDLQLVAIDEHFALFRVSGPDP